MGRSKMELGFKNYGITSVWKDIAGYAKLVADQLERSDNDENLRNS